MKVINLFNVLNDYSLEIYNLINNKKAKKKVIYKAFLSGNKESFLKTIPNILEDDKNKLLSIYKKKDILDKLLYNNENIFTHLKEIKDIVNIDKIINTVITDSILEKKINLFYTDLILDLFLEDFYDSENIKIISNLKLEVINRNNLIDFKIINNIRRYYIKKITI